MVKQYDVYQYPRTKGTSTQYVIVLQSGDFASLKTAIVAPISSVAVERRLKRLHIPIIVDGQNLCIEMPELGSYTIAHLKKFISSHEDLHDNIISAIDLIFVGF
jgi:CcdB protein